MRDQTRDGTPFGWPGFVARRRQLADGDRGLGVFPSAEHRAQRLPLSGSDDSVSSACPHKTVLCLNYPERVLLSD